MIKLLTIDDSDKQTVAAFFNVLGCMDVLRCDDVLPASCIARFLTRTVVVIRSDHMLDSLEEKSGSVRLTRIALQRCM